MTKKSSAHYQREYRKRLREQGLVKKEVWVLPENNKLLAATEKQLRKPLSSRLELNNDETKYENRTGGSSTMESLTNSASTNKWTTEDLFSALKERPAFNNKSCSIEIIDGLNSTIVIAMHNYGDLPVFITVGGDQILAEAVLFALEDVKDTNKFNEYVLKTHKYLPLSTISIETDPNHGDYYYMFGALSAASSINEIVLEVETLAENTIQATEAFQAFLKN